MVLIPETGGFQFISGVWFIFNTIENICRNQYLFVFLKLHNHAPAFTSSLKT